MNTKNNRMRTHTFIKTAGQWFINLPAALREYNQTDYTYVENSGGLLDEIAAGRTRIAVCWDTEPFRNALILELEPSGGSHSEALYRLRKADGVLLRKHLPLLCLGLFLYGELPERIFLRGKTVHKSEKQDAPLQSGK